MIYGICGLQGSGKDTIADILITEHNFKKMSFADPLKDITNIIFGWDRDMLQGLTKESREEREKVDKYWSDKLDNFDKAVTPRKMLQYLGTDLFRDCFQKNIWILVLEKKLSEYNGNIVITDCRFPDEIKMIKKLVGEIINVNRNNPIWFEDYKNGKVDKVDNVHISELSWIRSDFDHVIDNSGSLDELNKIVFNLINL